MNNRKQLDELLKLAAQQLKEEGFSTADDFKRRFWNESMPGCEAAAEVALRRPKPPVFRHLAAAAVLLLAAGAFLLFGIRANRTQASWIGEADQYEELAWLFNDGTGAGFIQGEVFTFERSGKDTVTNVLELEFTDSNGKPLKVSLLAGEDDFLKLDTPLLSGTIFLQKLDDGSRVLEHKLILKTGGGKPILREGILLLDNDAPAMANGETIRLRKLEKNQG